MMRRRTMAALAAGALLGAPAEAAEKIEIAALTLVSSSPLLIAEERGSYAAEELDAELVFFRATQPVAVAIGSSDADFGVTAFTAGFFNLAGEGAVKVIGAQSREEPGFDFSAYLASNQADAAGLDAPESPKQLARFERAASLLDRDAKMPLPEVAQACGFYDQAHLCRDVGAFAGESPTALRRRTLADGTGVMADPG
jgi:hypothetical protein